MLKKQLMSLSLITFTTVNLFSHDQLTHQKITREAFKLLCKSYPQMAISEMATFIGTGETIIPSDPRQSKSWGASK